MVPGGAGEHSSACYSDFKVQFVCVHGHGLHSSWWACWQWDVLRFSAPLFSFLSGLPGFVGKRRTSARLWSDAARAGVRNLWPDSRTKNRSRERDVLLRRTELDGRSASRLLCKSAQLQCGRETLAARDASRADPGNTPFPSGPRNRDALCRQLVKPSWKVRAWPPPPPGAPCRCVCRKRTVCSRISAFSTLRCVDSCDKRQRIRRRGMRHIPIGSCSVWPMSSHTCRPSPLPACAAAEFSSSPGCGLFSPSCVSPSQV